MAKRILGTAGSLVVTAFPAVADFLTAPVGVSLPATIPLTNWTATIASDLQDVTDTASGGWAEFIAGVKSCDLTLAGFWDATDSAVDLATILNPGRPVTVNLLLGQYQVTVASGVATGTTDPKALQMTAYVESFKLTNDPKAPITFEVTAKATGSVSLVNTGP